MAPKNKGKGKAKAKGRGSSSGQEGVRATHTFVVILDELGSTYRTAMESIPRALRELLIAMAPRKKNNKTRLKRVHKKLYTLNGGNFMIRIMPSRDSPPEQHLTLLFRWFYLYYVAYHCREVWYRFDDDLKMDLPLPPCSQLFYKNQKKGGVVDLPYKTSYDNLGDYRIYLGPKSFWDLYEALMQSAELKEQGHLNHLFQLCQMALPPVAFSEASRFCQLLEWVLTQTALDANHKGERTTPAEYYQHFNAWGSDSRTMFETRDGAPPQGIAGRLAILKTPGRTVEIPITRGPHEKASESSEEDV